MIKEVTNYNQKQKLKTEFIKVFKNRNPFIEVFQESIKEKLIVYPTDGYYLTQEQFEALIIAAKVIGDKEIYISEVESVSDCFATIELNDKYQCKHWIAEIPVETSEYNQIKLLLENAIYSPLGKWGIIISHEEHAVLGGTSEFIKSFKANYDSWNEDIKGFMKNWERNKEQYNSELNWLPILIKHTTHDDS